MSKKKLEVLGALITIFGLVILLLFLFLWQPKPSTAPEQIDQPDQIDQIQDNPNEIVGPPIISPKATVRSFVERFGSFSTESNYTNVDDVMVLATTDLQSRLRTLAQQARSELGGSFYGVSTRVISMEVLDEKDTTASVLVTTQRAETFETPANTSVKYQEIELDLVRMGDTWLVSDFAWK